MLSRSRTITAAVFAASSLLVLVAAAPAAADPSWGCRASVGYVVLAGEDRVEPLVANGNINTSQASPDSERCADDEARISGDQTVGPVTQRNAFARTSIHPDTGEPAAQSVLTAEVEELGFLEPNWWKCAIVPRRGEPVGSQRLGLAALPPQQLAGQRHRHRRGPLGDLRRHVERPRACRTTR